MTTTFDLQRAAMAIVGASSVERHVLLVLALRADIATRRCTPGIARLVADTGLSERAVQNATKALAAAGHITRDERRGRGIVYTVHPRTTCTPEDDAPPQDVHPRTTCTPAPRAGTPAPRAPKQPGTTITPKRASPSQGTRTRSRSGLPGDWQPAPLTGRAAAAAADWRPDRIASELDRFRNHAAATGRAMADWDAAWRNWVTGADRFDKPDAKPPDAGNWRSRGRFRDPLLNAFENEPLSQHHES
ncbi:hypothetical protein GCM10022253_30140 [Sphingomonas endophytica]|uniref:Helix-turn-helix domain-containing protein n=1 Tax=Sphingomonas endophytica TaxID=869719 RepID=A0ABR6N747_9SPHN|nr:helix-turn-helix domain-containing protein [Sphingomonas endophytica]MBB5726620.1 hypothetical protein [Sphingomonas endophytica]